MIKKILQAISAMLFTCSFIQCQQNPEYLLFSSGRNGNSDIFLIDINGNNLQQLTKSENEEWGPTWMNDHTISFLRQRGENITRHNLDINTLVETELEHPENCVLDDKNILYGPAGEQVYSCEGDIFFISANGTIINNLSENIDGISLYPSWSYDGQQIFFTNNANGTNDIYSVNVNSRTTRPFVNEDSNDERAELSPDGLKLLYSSDRFEKGNQDIVVFDLQTKELMNISNSPGTELIARWNDSGDIIFYGSNKDGNWEIYRYDLSSKTETRLTINEAFDGDPRLTKF